MKDHVSADRDTVRSDPHAAVLRSHKDRSLRCESRIAQIERCSRDRDTSILRIISDHPSSGKKDTAPHVDIFREAHAGPILTGVSRHQDTVLRTRLEPVMSP